MRIHELTRLAEPTEEESKEKNDLILAFQQETTELCKKHGLQHVAQLHATAAGIVPVIAVQVLKEE